MIKKPLFFLITICLLFGITSCDSVSGILSNTPIQVTRKFMDDLNSNHPDRALDFICESMALPALPEKYAKDLHYVELTNDEASASVEVTGEIRVDEESLGAAKKNLNFVITLQKEGKDWCIERESLLSIINSMTDFSY
ncbi:MAG: hypothetical protein ACD_35C00313G0002 [uncultured bacterium]|nr:MAG: hypothetical protein ACD_35C00313G0002 [uncultured bacterium]